MFFTAHVMGNSEWGALLLFSVFVWGIGFDIGRRVGADKEKETNDARREREKRLWEKALGERWRMGYEAAKDLAAAEQRGYELGRERGASERRADQ